MLQFFFGSNLVPQMADFVGREEAKDLARKETVILVEIMGEAKGKRSLEVHVMRPTAEGLYAPVVGRAAAIDYFHSAHAFSHATAVRLVFLVAATYRFFIARSEDATTDRAGEPV